jgi:hypothetical protein
MKTRSFLFLLLIASCTRTDRVGLETFGVRGAHARSDGTCDPGLVNCAGTCEEGCDAGSQCAAIGAPCVGANDCCPGASCLSVGGSEYHCVAIMADAGTVDTGGGNPDATMMEDSGTCLADGQECNVTARPCCSGMCSSADGSPGHCIASTGCSLTSMPPGIDFGTLAVGSTGAQTFTLFNNGGAACPINGMELDDTSQEFTFAPPMLPAVLQPGQSIAADVGFDPTQAGTVTATIIVRSTGAVVVLQVSVIGRATGTLPDASIMDSGTQCVTIGDPCTDPSSCCSGGTCNPSFGICVLNGLDAGMCVANGQVCSTNSDCCSDNCITRVSPGRCCQPGGCP